MKPTINKTLPCAVFGHNYVKSKTNDDHSSELTCSHCNAIVKTDANGNFDELSISNKHIQSTLRQLFHLNLQISKPKFS
ncbi:hypothetical protein [Winogradskyella sp.]|jgi:hypothetical protein|uniref:hypothetical protein n=1 Tax=Winogradskyella sp. TaxID=1883156 RepID=UPI0025F5EFE1|nr:hypothetical protein [Winogradskyella sp.]MCT4628308.1 hypothetical protein [Winogradskyella sp.]